MTEPRILTGAEAIREAIDQAMADDERLMVIGEGVPDPKGVFGTTIGLREKYGSRRVFDMPVSENSMTGMCLGAALRGLKVIMTHQRVDFSLYAFEQIVNNVAKWNFMFQQNQDVPFVIRMVMGRGWGQGAQHSQNLQALFAHVPGLTVVTPAMPSDTKGLFLASISLGQPVIFLEHRWIHGLRGAVSEAPYEIPLGWAAVRRPGSDVSIVANSYQVVESLRAAELLAAAGVAAEVVDLMTVRPLDWETVAASVRKTGRLLVVDGAWPFGGLASEILARVAEGDLLVLKASPRRLTLPDIPTPSAPALTRHYYPSYREIVGAVVEMTGGDVQPWRERWRLEETQRTVPYDIPDQHFTGPF